MRWISIDPGIHCGYAVWEDEMLLKSGYFHPKATKETNSIIKREQKINFLRKMLQSVITEYSCEMGVIEIPILPKFCSDTIITQFRVFGAIVDLVIYDNKLQYAEYKPNRIKKWSTGFGHASKPHIQDVVRDIFGEENAISEDQADAVAVGMCHIAMRRLVSGQPRLYPTDKYYNARQFKSDEEEKESLLYPKAKRQGKKKGKVGKSKYCKPPKELEE